MDRWAPIVAAVVAALLVAAVAAWLVWQEEEPAGDGDDEQAIDDDEDPSAPGEETSPASGDEVTEEDAPSVVVDGDELPETNASVEVTSARIDEGDCVADVPGEGHCHRLQVAVRAHDDEDLNVAIPLWEAVDDEGERHPASWVVSPEPVPAGTTRTVEVLFDLDAESRLVTLDYADFQGRTLSAQVPEYG